MEVGAHRGGDHVGGEPEEQAAGESGGPPGRESPGQKIGRCRRAGQGGGHEDIESGDRTEQLGDGGGQHPQSSSLVLARTLIP